MTPAGATSPAKNGAPAGHPRPPLPERVTVTDTAPYYQDDSVTLYHGDCLDIDAWLAADVLITDPPYGTQFSPGNPKGGYGRRNVAHDATGFTIAGDDSTATRDHVLSLWGQDRPALVFGSPRFGDPPGTWDFRLVWDKVEPGMNGGPWRYTHESIFVRGQEWVRLSNRSYSILRFPRSDGMGNDERAEHPHRKPVALLEALVGASMTGVIADPFCGTGTTLLAARNTWRRAIGVEIEERYCEIAANRLAQGVLL